MGKKSWGLGKIRLLWRESKKRWGKNLYSFLKFDQIFEMRTWGEINVSSVEIFDEPVKLFKIHTMQSTPTFIFLEVVNPDLYQ